VYSHFSKPDHPYRVNLSNKKARKVVDLCSEPQKAPGRWGGYSHDWQYTPGKVGDQAECLFEAMFLTEHKANNMCKSDCIFLCITPIDGV
jgi:hypothetical protein